jgi:tetratricopeptide (TPR) repeat protein
MNTDRPRAYELRYRGCEIASKYGDEWAHAYSLYSIGELLFGDGQLDDAEPWFNRSLEFAIRLRIPWGLSHVYFGLASLAYARGNLDDARRLFEESLAASRKINYPNVAPWAYVGLSRIACEAGDFRRAKQYAEDMAGLERNLGREDGIASSLLHIANACDGLGDYEEAARCVREAASLHADPLSTLLLLTLSGRLLVRRGEFAAAVAFLQTAVEHADFARLTAYERKEAEAALSVCKAALSAADVGTIDDSHPSRSLDTLVTLARTSL